MAEKQQALARVILQDPAVESLSSFIGVDGTNPTLNSGRILINLKPLEERKESATEILRRLQQDLARVEGITLYMQPVQDLTVDTRISRTQYRYTLEDPDIDELNRLAPRLVETLRAQPELGDVSSDQQDKGLQVVVSIDRSTASRLGITPQLVDDTLYDAFGQRQVSTIFTQSNQYRVVLAVKPDFQQHPERLQMIYLRSAGGGQVPLGTISQITETTGPLVINRQGQFPAVTLSFNPASGASLGKAVKAVESATQEMGLPASIRASFQGTAQAFQASLTNEPILILAALITVYIVLGVLYESYIHPITILSTLPSAGVGAVLALMIFRTELSVIAVIGIILLIGIVKKNGIMMVDFALEAERKEGKSPVEAIYQASLLRFRPIMMTTMAALLGALPLALGDRGGIRASPPAGHLHRRRAHLQPGAYPLYHPGDLSRLRPAGAKGPRPAFGKSERTRARPRPVMNISAIFINRPVATTLLTIGLVLAGALAYQLLPVSPLPHVDFPTIAVSATLPGANPETMATSVAAPLERQFGFIAGVTEMTSTSYLGSASIVLQFDLDRNIDGAARDVQAAINAARGYLPPALPSNPIYRKVNPAEAPVLIIALTSDTINTAQMYDAASSIMQQKLSQVKGVGQIFVGGSSLPAVRVDLNPTALNKYGISLEGVRGVLASTSIYRPKGQMADGARTWEIQTNDQLRFAEQYRPLILTYRAGAAVRLPDVADVQNSVEDLRAAGSGKREAGGDDRHLSAARRQYHRYRRPHPSPAPPDGGRHARGDQVFDRFGPDAPDSRFSARCRTDARNLRRARDLGGIHLPAKHPLHRYPRCGSWRLAHRHLWGDVPFRLQSGQSVSDGPHHCHGVCR